MLSAAPEILVGYMPGYRSSWQTVMGARSPRLRWKTIQGNGERITASIHASCRGVLISNRKSRATDAHLYDLTVFLMQEFGVAPGPGMNGHNHLLSYVQHNGKAKKTTWQRKS